MLEGSQRRPAVTDPGAGDSLWTTVVFPTGSMRSLFRERVELLNRVEDLPRIQLRDSPRRTELDYWCIDYRRIGLRNLVEACGGTIVSDRAALARFEERWTATASALS